MKLHAMDLQLIFFFIFFFRFRGRRLTQALSPGVSVLVVWCFLNSLPIYNFMLKLRGRGKERNHLYPSLYLMYLHCKGSGPLFDIKILLGLSRDLRINLQK